MINNSDFGDKIKELRKKNNLTQKELADKLNVTYQAVSKWERGENYPDLIIIKEISKIFNIDINELMDLEVNKENKNNNILILLFMLLISFIIIVIIVVITINNSSKIELKNLSTSCSNFELSGSIAYNKDKTSIHISSIDYCGVDEDIIYKNIKSTLYENNNGNISVISEINEQDNISIKEYLTDLRVHIDNYKKTCKIYNESSIYIELELEDTSGKNTIYKIPLTIDDECD